MDAGPDQQEGRQHNVELRYPGPEDRRSDCFGSRGLSMAAAAIDNYGAIEISQGERAIAR